MEETTIDKFKKSLPPKVAKSLDAYLREVQ